MSRTITIAAGRVAHDGTIELRNCDGYRTVEPTREPIVAMLTPLGVAVAELCAAEVADEPIVQDDTTATEQANKPIFSWADENLGGQWTATGRLHWNWRQPEEDWIRTGC